MPAPPKGGEDKRASCDAVGYTLLNGCLFCSAFSSKFSPATAGDIDCNFSLSYLPKDDKKAADILICTPKVRHFRRCIFLCEKEEKTRDTRQNSRYPL